jgi:hypothetical protein
MHPTVSKSMMKVAVLKESMLAYIWEVYQHARSPTEHETLFATTLLQRHGLQDCDEHC